MSVPVVYISIGNSDDRLTQHRWSAYIQAIDALIDNALIEAAGTRHGVWFSAPDSPFQNACWAIQLDVRLTRRPVRDLRRSLRILAEQFGQESIAWAVAPRTEFLRPTPTEFESEEEAP